MARRDPNGLIELGGDFFVAHPTERRPGANKNRPKAHTHKHRHQWAAAIQMMIDLNGRSCVVCGEPISIERQANAVFCEHRGPCARKWDNISRRRRKRLSRSVQEMREMHGCLISGQIAGRAKLNATIILWLWLETNGPNVRSKLCGFGWRPKHSTAFTDRDARTSRPLTG